MEWHFKLPLLAKTWRNKTDKSIHIQCHQSRWIFVQWRKTKTSRNRPVCLSVSDIRVKLNIKLDKTIDTIYNT